MSMPPTYRFESKVIRPPMMSRLGFRWYDPNTEGGPEKLPPTHENEKELTSEAASTRGAPPEGSPVSDPEIADPSFLPQNQKLQVPE